MLTILAGTEKQDLDIETPFFNFMMQILALLFISFFLDGQASANNDPE